jgi:hypothetical protein
MSNVQYEACPECAVEGGGWTRQAAFDAFFGGHEQSRRLPQRKVLVEFTADRADPTAFAKLACGHTVMA